MNPSGTSTPVRHGFGIGLGIGIALLLSACAAGGGTRPTAASPSTSNDPNVKIVKSEDGRFEGEMVGTPAAGSKFSKVRIGMEMPQVQQLIGTPDLWHTHETGKRWIPFYFGNDTRRLQALYKGEGCLSFTGGNVWGGGGNELIRIEADPGGKCYQP